MSKKNFKKKEKEDLDPILKKKTPQSKPKEEDIDYQFEDDIDEDDKPEEEKLSFDKFRDMFRPKKANKTNAKRILKEENRLKLVDNEKNYGHDKLPFASRKTQNIKNHFDLPHDTLVKSKLQLVSESLPTAKNQLGSNFSYDFDEDDEEDGQAERLNNQIKIKEYKLNPELKTKGKLYSDPSGGVWLSDNALEAVIKKEKGLQSDLDVHETILSNMGTLDVEEEQEFKMNMFKMMESYVDMVYADANEEHVSSVKEIISSKNLVQRSLRCPRFEPSPQIQKSRKGE